MENLKTGKIYNKIAFFILIIFFLLSFLRYRLKKEIITDNRVISVKLIHIECTSARSQHSSGTFADRGKIHNFNFSSVDDCSRYLIGDTVRILCDESHEDFYPLNVGTSDEMISMSASGVAILAMIFWFFYDRERSLSRPKRV